MGIVIGPDQAGPEEWSDLIIQTTSTPEDVHRQRCWTISLDHSSRHFVGLDHWDHTLYIRTPLGISMDQQEAVFLVSVFVVEGVLCFLFVNLNMAAIG